MKKFLNINKQRIFAFFASFLTVFFCVFGFVSFPASAHFDSAYDYQAPFGFLFNEAMTYEGYPFSAEFPFGVSTSAFLTNYNYVLFDDTGIAFGQSFENYDYVYLWDSGWVAEGPFWLYSEGIPDANLETYQSMELFLSHYGTFYLLHDSYRFKEDGLILPNLLTQEFNFVSNGLNFEGLTCLLGSMYYIQNGSNILVYRNGVWIDQAFRNISLSRYVPRSAILIDFWLQNQFVQPSFLDRVTSGLSAVISWVGTVVTAIVSGELVALLPLVAIGIAVSALLLAWVFIRRFIWGS